MAVLSLMTLLLATKYCNTFAGLGSKYAKLLVETAKMYILGAIAVAILYFMARAKLRIHWLRWVVLGSATAVDIFFGARFIVDLFAFGG
jgi:arginine exporter protein ArgO